MILSTRANLYMELPRISRVSSADMSNVWSSSPMVGIVLGVVLALAGLTATQNLTEKEWWEDTVVYEIWPKSFQDSDGDGSGDLQGIISHLDHFEELGVETIWLNTIFPSPLANSGFDVSDYQSIDSTYGDLTDFDQLITEAHARSLKVIIDFIPNHSSVEHPWFNSSVYRIEPYTDYYVWHNGTLNSSGVNVAPNNWASVLSTDEEGSAWEWNTIRQQWYLHQFSSEEADLDLRNENVIQELSDVLLFWLDRGVDGFYVNGVPYFLEDEDFTDNPTGSLNSTFGLAGNVALLQKFREQVDAWVLLNDNVPKFLVAEGFEDDENLIVYYGNDTSEGVAPVNVHFITDFTSTSNASYIKSQIDAWISALPTNQTTNWKLSNQDYSRVATRYGLNRADGLSMLVLALPGRVFTYYGEEIAMLDSTEITYAQTVDPLACTAGETSYADVSRDPYRTPMQWDTTTNAGFTTGSSPYLPVNTNYATINVATQLASTRSSIQTYKAAAALRSKTTFQYGDYEIQALNNDRVLVLRRYLDDYPTYILAINLALSRQTVNLTQVFTDLPTSLNISVLSNNAILSGSTVSVEELTLTANAAVMLTDDIVDVVEEEATTTEDAVESMTTTEAEDGVPTTTEAENDVTTTKTEDEDSDGDGIGDLRGIISRLHYLADIGVTGFSLTPIYPSPQVDGGYDISNFTEIDSMFGSFADFQEMVDTAHDKNLKVILDFVPNHSSAEHIWFKNSVARIDPYTDYYVWRDGIASNGTIQPPNNWLSAFGGSAWSWNEQRQQYYLHQFHARQPDFNFRNSAVIAEITNVLIFWLNQGIDGFRISSVAHLFEDANFPNEPINPNPDPNILETDYDYLHHIYTTNLDETIEVVYQWRTVVDGYAAQADGKTRILITDSLADPTVVSRYFGNQTHQGAHLPLNFGIVTRLTQSSPAPNYVNAFDEWFATLPENCTSNWIFGTHDHGRVASRLGLNRAIGLTLLHLLPGTSFTYMGEELALLDTEISFVDSQDPHAINAGPDRFHLFTRDPVRTPYHWDNSTSGGFSANTTTWLPVNSNYLTRNAAAQIAAERSVFRTYEDILELKQTETIKRGATRYSALGNAVLAFTRELEDEAVYAILINLGLAATVVDLSQFSGLPSEGIRVCVASPNSITTTGTVVDITAVSLSANAAVVLCNSEITDDTVPTTTAPTTIITTRTSPPSLITTLPPTVPNPESTTTITTTTFTPTASTTLPPTMTTTTTMISSTTTEPSTELFPTTLPPTSSSPETTTPVTTTTIIIPSITTEASTESPTTLRPTTPTPEITTPTTETLTSTTVPSITTETPTESPTTLRPSTHEPNGTTILTTTTETLTTTTGPSTTMGTPTESPTTTTTMEPSEPDSSEEDTEETSNRGTAFAYSSSILFSIALWNILLF